MTAFLRFGRRVLAAWFATMAFAAPLAAQPAAGQALTPAQKSEVEAVIRDYLKGHPDVIIDALRGYQEQQQSAEQERTNTLLRANRKALENDGHSFAVGPEQARVTVVEFFDYRCPYCKQMVSSVMKLISERPDVRVVLKELPVLGPDSVTASHFALAALHVDPGKYLAFHQALLAERGALTEDRVLAIARKAGLDPDRLRAAKDDPSIAAQLAANHSLAEKLQIAGTPTFVIGDAMVPGAVAYSSLVELVDDAAKHCVTC